MNVMLLFQIMLLVFFKYACGRCTTSQCTGYFRLQESQHKQLNISRHNYETTLFEAPDYIDGYILSLRRYWNYQYEGGALDPNSGCKPVYDYPPLTPNEAEEWITRSKCRFGYTCGVDSDCWGGDSDKCLLPKREIRFQWAKSKQAENFGKCWSLFSHHTCVMDWECNLSKYKFPTTIISPTKLTTELSNGTTILIDNQHKIYDLGKGNYLYIPLETRYELIHKEECTINCIFSDDEQRSVCVTGQTCTMKGKPLRYVGDGFWCSRKICAHLNMDKRIEETKGLGENNDKAASQNDLVELRTYLLSEIDRNDLNLGSLLRHVDELEKVTLRTVNHLAKTNPTLLGYVKGLPYMTKYMSPSQFTLCKCDYPNPLPEEICNKKAKIPYIYKDGEYSKWNQDDQCFRPLKDIMDKKIRPMTLINDTEIADIEIEMPEIVGASFQWEGWQWLANHKEEIEWTISESKETFTDGIMDTINSPLFNPWNLLISSISSYVSWISLIISAVALCRRGY